MASAWDWPGIQDPAPPGIPHLPLGRHLLVVAVGGVSGDGAGPERAADGSVGAADHQQRQQVQQDRHGKVVPGKNGIIPEDPALGTL